MLQNIYLVLAKVQSVPGIFHASKLAGREVHHSSLSMAEVKNEWSCTSNPPYGFIN